MSDRSSTIAWGQVVISALVTAVLSLIGGVLLFHYTSKSPDLVYDTFPPAHFTKHATQVSIYNAQVENIGDKEAEDVQVYLELPSSANIQDLKVDPSLASIKYTVSSLTDSNSREIHFPRLNQGESCRFSILVDKGEAAQLKVELRGKGVVGHAEVKEKSTLLTLLACGLSALLGALLATLFFAVGQGFSEKRLGDLFNSQKRLLDQELLLARTREKTPQADLKDILLSTPYRLFFNPAIPGLSKTKIMRFGEDGAILEGQNNNETSWCLRGDLLELLDAQGRVHSRFYYSLSDQRFYHTNDPDTGSIQKHGIRDQYMVPEDTSNN